jgi:phosphoribosylamine--glycine ligase
VFVAPGNAGTAREPGVTNVAVTAVPELVAFARENDVGLTIVGPEAPLAAGVVDAFREAGLAIVGPTRAAAQLEASKDYAKAFMARHGIPTAAYRTFTDAREAKAYVAARGAPIVVKADGLAAGRGVVVATTVAEATARSTRCSSAIRWARRAPASSSRTLAGEEASFIVLVDGRNVLPLASSQDHKRLGDGDTGPNTGGMGAYSPAPVVTPALHARIMREVIMPTVEGMAADGIPYTGFLYAGVMIDASGTPRVLEFNCRLGDPETQPIVGVSERSRRPRRARRARRSTAPRQWDRRAALGVVLAAAGSPDRRAARPDHGLERIDAARHPGVAVFHAGTALRVGRSSRVADACCA